MRQKYKERFKIVILLWLTQPCGVLTVSENAMALPKVHKKKMMRHTSILIKRIAKTIFSGLSRF